MSLARRVAELLSADALFAAISEAAAQVKARPQDTDGRVLLGDLLILAGDYERADRQLHLAASTSPADAAGLGPLRKQLRGMFARNAWFEDGAVPDFPDGPTACDRAALRLNVLHRAGDRDGARRALEALESLRGARGMRWNGTDVTDFRDLDDRIPHALEVITTGGAYLWVDFARIAAITAEPIVRPRDLAFRRARLRLTDGANAPVLLPAIYHSEAGDEAMRLGRRTDWIERESGITAGLGQRCFLAGEVLVGLHETARLSAPGEGGTDHA